MNEHPKSVYTHERIGGMETAIILQMDDRLLATAVSLALVSLPVDHFTLMKEDLEFFLDRVEEIYQRLSAIVANDRPRPGDE